jgi:hypothetical protein
MKINPFSKNSRINKILLKNKKKLCKVTSPARFVYVAQKKVKNNPNFWLDKWAHLCYNIRGSMPVMLY